MIGIKIWKTAIEAKYLRSSFQPMYLPVDAAPRREKIPIPEVLRCREVAVGNYVENSHRVFATFSPPTISSRRKVGKHLPNFKAYVVLRDIKIPISNSATSHVSMFLTSRTRTLPIFHLPTRSLILRTPHTRSITSRSTKNEIIRLKKPSRGGRNLSERYRALERALRGKEAFARGKGELAHHVPVISISVEDTNSKKESVETFHGFVVPQEPKPPADDGVFPVNNPYPDILINHITECCMSGCAVCVYDLYEESLASYEDSIITLRKSLGALGIPQKMWPLNVRPDVEKSTPESRKEVILNAFEEMERKLKEKKGEEDGKS